MTNMTNTTASSVPAEPVPPATQLVLLPFLAAVEGALRDLGHPEIRPDAPVSTLAPAALQVVEIARALIGAAQILVLDEPTSALSQDDAQRLFALIKKLKATGITVVGIDIKEYLVKFASPEKPISAEQLTRDYDAIARLAVVRSGVDRKAPLLLAGWSLGAGYSVIVASQPEFSLPVSRVVAISLPRYGELAWRPADAPQSASRSVRARRTSSTPSGGSGACGGSGGPTG